MILDFNDEAVLRDVNDGHPFLIGVKDITVSDTEYKHYKVYRLKDANDLQIGKYVIFITKKNRSHINADVGSFVLGKLTAYSQDTSLWIRIVPKTRNVPKTHYTSLDTVDIKDIVFFLEPA